MHLGLGGIATDHDRAAVTALTRALGLAPVEATEVENDCHSALAGALSGRAGLVVIAGTGSLCFGRNAAGATWRSGGWGPLLADEGSAYWFGVQALRSTVQGADGRLPSSALAAAVLAALAAHSVDELMGRVYGESLSRAAVAALAPLIFRQAAAQDATAQRLVAWGR